MSGRAAIYIEGTAQELAVAFARYGCTAGNAQFVRVAWSLETHGWTWLKITYSYRRSNVGESAIAPRGPR